MRARAALGESLAEPSGQLRISALHLAKNLVIAPMLNEFVRRYPKVQLEIRYEDQLVDIVRERLDAGIRLADALQPGMVGVQLHRRWRACWWPLRPTSPSTVRRPASPTSMGMPPCASVSRAVTLHKWRLREDGRELEVDLPARFVSTDTEAIIEAARAGAGIAQAFIRERVAADLAAGRLVEVLPGSCLPLPPMWLYYLNRRHVPAKLRAFIELLREWRQPA
ncbi:LysR substrate-binding domain-containing protein [Pseudomonas aeruginosa]